LGPEFYHEKDYVVQVTDKLRANFKEKMEAGVDIEGYKTKPCKVFVLSEKTFRIVLTEGKKHQIRRMVAALFNRVRDIKRVRIMNIQLGQLEPGAYRHIEGKELKDFLKKLGL
jgi:23S rRNA pseudouridine2604 synthase